MARHFLTLLPLRAGDPLPERRDQPAAARRTLDRLVSIIPPQANKAYDMLEVLQELVDRALDQTGLQAADLKMLIPHQSNLRIIESFRKRMNLPEEKVAVNIEKYGNTSSASIPLALEEAVQSGRLKEGQLVCLVAFGGGLSWGATLLRW